jgi:hypothetical protein
LALSAENGDQQSAFDLATAYGCAARAYVAIGQHEKAHDAYAEAREHMARLEADDQALFEKLYPTP